jgi:hypothetical protein
MCSKTKCIKKSQRVYKRFKTNGKCGIMIFKNNKIWKFWNILKGFDNYQVSNLRNVRSEKGKEFRLLKGLNNGYEMCYYTR